jgi:predicted RNA binding protein YcfA (HicA-like mRNA interferase family)
MPKKIRELISALEKRGFINRGGKGSHRNFLHPLGAKLTISGRSGDDAKKYQEKLVSNKIEEAKNA